MEIIFFLFFSLIFGIIGAVIAENKRRSGGGGFLLGFFLGLIGIAIIALMDKIPEENKDEQP